MIIAYTLSMPGCPSWDGKWSGEGKLYAIVRTYKTKARSEKMAENLGSHSHFWSDGWHAQVTAREVDAKLARKLRQKSQGFNGYDWMVDSIEQHGRIRVRVHDGEGRHRYEDGPKPEDWGQPRKPQPTS